MKARISYANDHRGNLRHNNREFSSSNVDSERSKNNITIVSESLAEAYEKLFGKAVAAYNAKQKRACRKIDNYYEKLFGEPVEACQDCIIQGKNKQYNFYEYVVALGDKYTTGFAEHGEIAEIVAQCLKEYAEDFQKRNTYLYLFNAVVHMDEATPHLHLDFIPYADGCNRGMSRQQSMNKALLAMGYGEGEDAIKKFTKHEREVFRKICEEHELNNYGIEIAEEQEGRGKTFSPDEYKRMKDEARKKYDLIVMEEIITEKQRELNDGLMKVLTKRGEEYKAVKQDIKRGKQEVKQIQSQIDIITEELAGLEKQKTSLSTEVRALRLESVTAQTENENLKKHIAEMQDEIQEIVLPQRPSYPTKPSSPRPHHTSKEDYAECFMGDTNGLSFIDRTKEKKRLYKEYEARVDEWNRYDEAVKEYNEITYPQWVVATKTVKALQERLRLVKSRQQALEKGERTFFYGEELRLKKQVKELEKQKEDLQSQLDFISSRMQSLAEQEYQRRRKHDAEVIEYYKKYCGISPDKIENAVAEQENVSTVTRKNIYQK